ncbi:LuxR C-terminal-related transcriptional regulator [Flexivirga oryzae]|uniref:Two-component system response regulator DesR n=1 Tax=Flexivirga oryzae TaxID=1794944 RepID=A0A839N0A4_9MICO|nr:two-component system response regulator DesR [Flexivirga oryzae]
MTSPARVAVIDNLPVILAGLRAVLPDVDFVAQASSVEQFMTLAPAVDVVVLDLKLTDPRSRAGLSGLAAVRAVTAAGCRVLVWTEEERPLILAQCIRSGARGISHKTDTPDRLEDAILTVAAGDAWFTTSILGLAELADRRHGMPTVTERQRQVLRARARGLSWDDIASDLYIVERTARTHLTTLTNNFATWLRETSPADLEHHLGLRPGDIND